MLNPEAAASSSPAVATRLHASSVALGEAGVLIRGCSGAGKSSLAAMLMSAACQAGRFAALVGDDRIDVSLRNGRLIARGHSAVQGMIELRGQGIVSSPNEVAAVVRLVVHLLPAAEIARYPGPEDRETELCGAKLPRLALPIGRSSYDCAVLILMYLQHAGTF
jgi:serine kinase of HPr protein (carbohydrate metabolism regulator)